MSRSGPRVGLLQPRWRSLTLLALFGVPAAVAVLIARPFTDALWFQELGQADTFTRMLIVKALVAASVAVASALFLLLNLRIAVRRAPSPVPRLATLATGAACLLAGAALGSLATQDWQRPLLWFYGGDFGIRDPVYQRDIGFFVFSLPFHEWVATLLLAVVAASMVLTLAVDRLTGATAWRPFKVPLAARWHIAVLASLALLVLAWRLWLEAFAVGLRQHPGSFPGVHYVDFHVRLPGLQLLSMLAVVCAAGLAVATFLAGRGRARTARNTAVLPLLALGLVSLVSQSWVPSLVQRIAVDPQPLEKERLFLREAISASRRAFSLDVVDVQSFAPRAITAARLERDRSQLDQVQLWDASLLRLQMQQLESETPYYRAGELTVDAYRTENAHRLVVIGTRELDLRRVAPAGRGWDNDRLAYTHGLGVFRMSASRVDPAGRPVSEDAALPVRESRVYFGQLPPRASAWVVVNTRRPEVDVPQAADPRERPYHYGGDGGIALSHPLRRMAFALRLGDLMLLISQELTPRSRIILHRDVVERLQTLAPFLLWDTEPAAVIADGRIVFLADGYTASDTYPGAEAVDIAGARVTYARAAVRATVDAFSGRAELHVADPEDPIMRAWAVAFPRLFQPMSRMPGGLRTQLRYPPALFDAQARLYERFHSASPDAFSTQADAWSRPTILAGPLAIAGDIRFDEVDPSRAQSPSYRLASPPGERHPRLLRSTLYGPRGAENLVATLDGWVDDQAGIRLSSLSLPRDRLTFGPAQMSRLAFTSPGARDELDLLNRETRDLDKASLASVTLGTPRVVFVSGGILQVQPVYVAASGHGVARMLSVIVFIDGCVGIGAHLNDALRAARDCLQ